MKNNGIKRAIDARLSGLRMTEEMKRDVLRQARRQARPTLRRKASLSLAFALTALLALATSAGAAAYLGVLHFHSDQQGNEAYQAHIKPIGEQIDGASCSLAVNDAVFDGTFLSLSLDIAHRPDAQSVYLYPRLTAKRGGETMPVALSGLQYGSEDFSSATSIAYLDTGYDGLFMLMRESAQGDRGAFNIDARIDAPDGDARLPVEWQLEMNVLRPVFPIEDAPMTSEELPDGSISYAWDNMEEDCRAAYAEGKILVDSFGSLALYALCLPVPDGMTQAQWDRMPLDDQLVASGAFTRTETLRTAFTTETPHVAGLPSPLTFDAGDYACTLDTLSLTFSRLEYEMTIRRKDGAPITFDGDDFPSFHIAVPNGQALASTFSGSVQEDGSVSQRAAYALTQPVSEVTFIPILPGHLSPYDMPDMYAPTAEERAMGVTVKPE